MLLDEGFLVTRQPHKIVSFLSIASPLGRLSKQPGSDLGRTAYPRPAIHGYGAAMARLRKTLAGMTAGKAPAAIVEASVRGSGRDLRSAELKNPKILIPPRSAVLPFKTLAVRHSRHRGGMALLS
jgi:hypothetical protein